jgi:hypothetical protein
MNTVVRIRIHIIACPPEILWLSEVPVGVAAPELNVLPFVTVLVSVAVVVALEVTVASVAVVVTGVAIVASLLLDMVDSPAVPLSVLVRC